MSSYYLYSKKTTKEELGNYRSDKIISKEKWMDVINNDSDYFWRDYTDMGKLEINHPNHPLDPKLYNTFAYCFYDVKKGYSDFYANYYYTHINFGLPRVTVQRLYKMRQLAEALDCYFVYGHNIIDDKKFQQLLEKYDKSKK